MRRRARGPHLLLALALLASACTGAKGASTPTRTPSAAEAPENVSTRSIVEAACSVPHELLLRTWRGVRLDRSGDVQFIPKEPNFVAGGLTHSGPWDYVQEVPLFLYGPGYVRPGTYDRPVTLADIAPTVAQFLKFAFNAPDGRPLSEAVLPPSERPLPRLVVTLVWDSAGMDVLNTWPEDWPYLRSLLSQGAWFTNATVGASPANTPVGHATIGTGAFPMHHGFVDEYVRVNGRIQKPNANGPGFLLSPTVADEYDVARENRSVVGEVATLSAHIMMMGHGSMWGGGDRDIAVTREQENAATAGAESVSWNLTSAMAPFYRLPEYVNQLPPISAYTRALDQADGALDGKWRENSIAQLHGGFDTPARTPYQSRLIEEVVQREGFGQDDVPDLLYLNYKAIDTLGHIFSLNSPEMSDAVRTQDDALKTLVDFLDRVVGEGRWVVALVADHGTQYDPEVSGAFMIDIDTLTKDVKTAFDADGDGVPLIEKVRPTEVWLDGAELADNGYTPADVSQFIMDLTQAQTIRPGKPLDPAHSDDRVFAAAFPSSILTRLPCLPEARAS